MSDAIERFEIHVDDAVLDDLHRRLAHARLPEAIPGTGWDAGIDAEYLRDLVEYWRDTYDWRAAETHLNTFEHFRTTVDAQPIHFVHARSPHSDALPLLLTHGWPGSIVEFLDVIPRLTHPERFGGDPADAFHVVAPSLPGYGFSPPPREAGWDPGRIAAAFADLMARLEHPRYGAQGGDWGAQVATRIGGLDPEHCVALHLNMPVVDRPPDPPVELTDADRADLEAIRRFQREESAYAQEQGTKPDTLGVALTDSPVGLLAWIVEKFRTWSDCDGDPDRCYTRDQLITNVMVYWVTGTITSSLRLYREARRSRTVPGFVAIPTGIVRFPREILPFPRAWVETRYRVTHWTVMERGGHFAAMEQPELFARDVQEFFRTVR